MIHFFFNSIRLLVIATMVVSFATPLFAEETLEPSDPFASVDGKPIYIGELNLVLTERISVRDLDRVPVEAKQATAQLLVQRHIAMRSLRQRGGPVLEASLERRVQQYASEAARRGTSIAEIAEARLANQEAMVADIAWKSAWSQYLKSRMTDANLRRFFESHRDQFDGGRWNVSQIFVRADADDLVSREAIMQQLTELVSEIRGSDSVEESFADVARGQGESGASDKGGRIGWVEKDGDLPSSVMDAVRKTTPGNVSDPVASPLGLHLVLVHQAEPGTGTFDDLTDQSQLRRDAANALFESLVDSGNDVKVVWFVDSLQPPH